ncbi:MAG: septum formation initiator family protein [Chitinophagaceae bacterium]|nr:septum formation initiator family protein [Chitinophagaceae bacterium]MCW5904668.1 septum formation initiator family protein [Chitinophagaceae bacterium]
MKKISLFLANKYILSISFFIVWMLFFDQKDFFSTLEKRKELRELQSKNAYYMKEIDNSKRELIDFQTNPAALEKFAREHYMLKKDGEDIFLVED